MRLYRWKARSSGGKAYNGEYYADDEKQVIDFIHSNYGYVTKIERSSDSADFHHWFQSRLNFTNKERAVFFKQLSTLLDAGIPIVNVIGMLTAGLSEKHRPVCHRLTLGLQSGKSLSQAMLLQPEIFTPMNISVIEAGETSGQLTMVTSSLSEFYKQQDKIIKLLRNVCIYPCFLLFLSVLTFIFFSIKLVPLFAELYHSLGVKETSLMQMLFSFSTLLRNYTVALSCICIAGGKLVLLQRNKILSLIMRMPGIRSLRHAFLEIRFARFMALLIRGGISFPEAILRSSMTLTDERMRKNAKEFSENVMRGVGITDVPSAMTIPHNWAVISARNRLTPQYMGFLKF